MQVFKYEPYSGMRLPTEEQMKIAAENYRKRRPPAAETDGAVDTRYDAGGHQAWPQAVWQVIVCSLSGF